MPTSMSNVRMPWQTITRKRWNQIRQDNRRYFGHVCRMRSSSSKHSKIHNRLKTINDVGLGCIKLGQSSTTLSGGKPNGSNCEQLGGLPINHCIFWISRPPDYSHDIVNLLDVLQKLLTRSTVIVVSIILMSSKSPIMSLISVLKRRFWRRGVDCRHSKRSQSVKQVIPANTTSVLKY